MHPAYSVIIFTVTSGAGFGLLAGLAALILWSGVLPGELFTWLGFTLAFALAFVGLLSSTFHLGRPERAWRALSQWRTSWLSREGVMSMATLGCGALLALLAITDAPSALQRIVAVPTLLASIATVVCTGMIYQSLPTIRAWHSSYVTPVYLVLSAASGIMLLHLLYVALGYTGFWLPWLALALLVLGAGLKLAYWVSIDSDAGAETSGTATGLSALGRVRPLEPPHTQANFVMREMGYAIARKHSRPLRLIAQGLGFVAPALLLGLSLSLGPVAGTAAALLACLAMTAGFAVERWLFFAEARHVVTLYYGAERA